MAGVPFLKPTHTREIFTDASLFGWGAHLGGDTISGTWSAREALQHINWLELEAVLRALVHFQAALLNQSVLIATDNTTVVSYINAQGGTHSHILCCKAQELHLWAQQHNISIIARHIPGKLNVVADQLSRSDQVMPTEWSLNHRVFKALCHLWGTPQVDLFATRFNAKLATYMSPMPDPLALKTDALSQTWTAMWAYAYPPPALLPQVLAKVEQDSPKQILLVAPNWPSQRWFPLLISLLIDQPRRLPCWDDLLSQPLSGRLHERLQHQDLHAWLLSSNSSLQKAFLRKQPNASQLHSGNPLDLSTSQSGRSSLIGAEHKS